MLLNNYVTYVEIKDEETRDLLGETNKCEAAWPANVERKNAMGGPWQVVSSLHLC